MGRIDDRFGFDSCLCFGHCGSRARKSSEREVCLLCNDLTYQSCMNRLTVVLGCLISVGIPPMVQRTPLIPLTLNLLADVGVFLILPPRVLAQIPVHPLCDDGH